MEDLTGGRTLSVAGTLKKAGGVLRLNGATINLAGHLGSAITFLDTNGGAINFTDGATFDNPNMNFEHKGNNTFSFKLAAGGFKTLAAGTLYSVNNGVFSAAWSNVTYNVDIADYDLRSGLRIVLMDFTAHQTKFNTDFNTAKVNITAGDSGLEAALSFETATSSLVLTFPYPVTWSGDNGENWRNALNWIPTNLPTASDTVLIKSGGSVTNAQNVFASIEIQTNATVKVGVDFFGGIGRTNSVAGILDKDKAGTLRLNGGTLELFGALGSNITWLDTQGGAINFTDGAAFRNGNMNFQHKGSNIFGYKLSETGFTTLIAGKLWTGDNQEGWSKVTYNVDISDYAGAMPAEIVLADYAGHTAEYNQPFDPEQSRPKVNITGLHGGSLSFDTATSKLILRVYGPKGTLILVH
ncbi:MAG: hypothetical protein PHO37_05845 [Kiritimatiellae bacterium]|nr:hypothetical protein [Kiritimatiellia bacterium]